MSQIDGVELGETESPFVNAFAIFKDLNMIAFSTGESVYLIDFESEFKFSTKIEEAHVVFISYVDIYIVMMMASDEDSSEA